MLRKGADAAGDPMAEVAGRADPLANKLNSAALCCVYDEHQKNPAAKVKSAAPG
ncbi:MAG TPA: hypothetical protein VMW52_05810 [Phycisphaerae bacterium]|nr:hypothetical protein [Phycisphaerae bacterium]